MSTILVSPRLYKAEGSYFALNSGRSTVFLTLGRSSNFVIHAVKCGSSSWYFQSGRSMFPSPRYQGMKAKSAYETFSPTRYGVPCFFRCASMTPVTRFISLLNLSIVDVNPFYQFMLDARFGFVVCHILTSWKK